MSALNDASKAQTSLLVTHQLEDTRDYDEIWVMDKGLIAERGTFAQLVAQNGLFASLLSQRNKEL